MCSGCRMKGSRAGEALCLQEASTLFTPGHLVVQPDVVGWPVGSCRDFCPGWLVGILHLNKKGPVGYPGEHSLFSTQWLAFSRPPPTSTP